jgi:seryl-tRNA synthetase
MIDLKLLRDPEHVERLAWAARVKQIDFDVQALVAADERRRALEHEVADLRARRRARSEAFKSATPDQREELGRSAAEDKVHLQELESELSQVQATVEALALRSPSIPRADVPVGTSDEDNVPIRFWGEPRPMDDDMADHIELVSVLGLAEFERAQRFAGARSYALTGTGAILARAVLDLAMDVVVHRGFMPVVPPVLVREAAMTGTGYFPLGVEDAYKTDREDRYLVGTSEVSLVSLHRDEVLQESELPIRYAGISTCFRREAGSHGRDTRGLYRVNQFDKVEQVVIAAADDELSTREHDGLTANAEAILQALELPYRVALACTGDMGQGQRLKHEIETWMPSRAAFSETHSCSEFGDFQGRRSNIRYRSADGNRFAYTLNNTAIAVPRALIPLLEHHQRSDRSVSVPEALRPYLNGVDRITADTRPADLVRRPGVSR